MSKLIPPGTMWFVETRAASIWRKEGEPVRGWSEASSSPWKGDTNLIEFPAGSTLIVGSTVTDFKLGVRHEFVEVLLPKHAYINRTLFNAGLGYLKRIA